MKKPVMSPEVEQEMLSSVQQYTNRDQWHIWGMHTIRARGTSILMYGPPGCGKTIIARWIAHRIKKGFRKLSVASIGGGEPGATEKNVESFFDDCRSRKNMTIFIDEADHILRDRSLIVDEGVSWMIGTVEALLMQINDYPGYVMLATNHAEKLDPALEDRFFSIIHVKRPDLGMRIKLWKQKIPESYPLKLSEGEIQELAQYDLSGRQIENAIVGATSYAMELGKKPRLPMLHKFSERETLKQMPKHE